MVQKIYIIGSKSSNIKEIVLKNISDIKGSILSVKNDTINWSYKYGKQEINCITNVNRDKIKTTAQNTGNTVLGEGVVINKFYNSLSEVLEIYPEKNIQLKTKSYHSTKNSQSLGIKIFAIVSVVLFIGFGIMKSQKDGNGSTYITQSGKMGSYNKESMEKLVKYSTHNDLEAINQLLYSGEIFEIPSGQEAYVVESEFPGKVKIRLKGETQEIWTFIEAIKHK